MIAEGYDLCEIPDKVYYYRDREGTITRDMKKLSPYMVENAWDIYQKALQSSLSDKAELLRVLRHKYVCLMIENAYYLWDEEDVSEIAKRNLERLSFSDFMSVAGLRQRLAYFIVKFWPSLWNFEKVRNFCAYKKDNRDFELIKE